MMDALTIYETLLGPSDGYFSTLLYNSDFDKDTDARLQLVFDSRLMKRPRWEFIAFGEGNSPVEHIVIEKNEIYGWLKARYPNKNWRKFIMEKVKAETLSQFEVFPKSDKQNNKEAKQP